MEIYTSSTDTELTCWWADNFNQSLETQTGHGAIDSIHIVEFSESPASSQEQVSQLMFCENYFVDYYLFLYQLHVSRLPF